MALVERVAVGRVRLVWLVVVGIVMLFGVDAIVSSMGAMRVSVTTQVVNRVLPKVPC